MSDQEKKSKRSKKTFLLTFAVTVAILCAINHLFSLNVTPSDGEEDGIQEPFNGEASEAALSNYQYTNDKYGRPHALNGVWSYDKCFPDINDVQIVAARKNGIKPVRNRKEILKLAKKHRLVNISNSPYYVLDDLTHSSPYLVPKAQQLLNTICINFIDSLQMKGFEPYLPMVTSVLRTTDDVNKLQRGNGNATTNSCHCYGTTVDISYNRFIPLTYKYDANAKPICWDENMKQVLSEVLNDLRELERCYVKYEVKQGCYHLTVR